MRRRLMFCLHIKITHKEDKKIVIGYSIDWTSNLFVITIKLKSLILQAPYYNFLEYSETRVSICSDFKEI
jgi:hypothetical protein